MAEAVKKILTYKSKKKMHNALTSALQDRIAPDYILKTKAPIEKKRGPQPNIVRNFLNDSRSDDMAIYIAQGLTVEEAGILAKFSPEELTQLQEKSDAYRRFVELQVIKFKQKHLKVISDKENPATSQWLLEQKFPETFGKRAKESAGQGSTHIIQAIVKSVQMKNDNLVVHEHKDISKKEGQDNSNTPFGEGDKPSLDVGGANILQ